MVWKESAAMRILMISGSRNPAGQTARAADAMLQGAADVGSAVERVFLPTQAIERCRQCDDRGWGTCKSEGRCTIDDDAFAQIVQKIRAADAVILATPVYFGDMSESMRAFTDRLRRICTHEAGRVGIEWKPAAVLCVAGGGGGGAPTCCVSLEKVTARCGFDIVDMIPARRQNLEAKLERLRLAGAWLATGPSSR
jgi:multimeric flavodoxin WrbA